MPKKKEKPSLDATLKKAKELGISYTEYQMKETLQMIQNEREKAKKDGKTRYTKNGK